MAIRCAAQIPIGLTSNNCCNGKKKYYHGQCNFDYTVVFAVCCTVLVLQKKLIQEEGGVWKSFFYRSKQVKYSKDKYDLIVKIQISAHAH